MMKPAPPDPPHPPPQPFLKALGFIPPRSAVDGPTHAEGNKKKVIQLTTTPTTTTATATLPNRLNYLLTTSLNHITTNPSLSHYLSRELVRVSKATMTPLAPSVNDILCDGCGCFLVPGKTARVRIKHRSRRKANDKKRKKKRGERGAVVLVKNEAVWTCLKCGLNKTFSGVMRQPPSNAAAGPVATNTSCKVVATTKPALPSRPPPPPEQQLDFIPLGGGGGGGGGRPLINKAPPLQPQPPRLLLDSKPRKRKRGGGSGDGGGDSRSAGPVKKQQNDAMGKATTNATTTTGTKSSSGGGGSLGSLHKFFSSLHKP